MNSIALMNLGLAPIPLPATAGRPVLLDDSDANEARRRQILDILRRHGPMAAAAIAEVADCSRQCVRAHLRILHVHQRAKPVGFTSGKERLWSVA